MKYRLLPLLAALALNPTVNAKIDSRIKERCLSAADYNGCLELNSEIVTLPKCNSSRKYNCFGELRYTNAYYVGEILNGKEHGFGTMNWANRDKYIGQWLNGEREGQGTYYWANGDKYVGQFKNSKRHGQGTYFYAEGGSCVGEFREGKMTKVDSCKHDDFW